MLQCLYLNLLICKLLRKEIIACLLEVTDVHVSMPSWSSQLRLFEIGILFYPVHVDYEKMLADMYK